MNNHDLNIDLKQKKVIIILAMISQALSWGHW